jgi:DNA repair protein RecO (recombination protein O)
VHAHGGLRDRGPALARATEACEAVLRLFDSAEPNVPAYNLLCHELALLDLSPEAARRAQSLGFRLKLLLAAGFVPELGSCASCGEREHLGGFSAGAGGGVCAAYEFLAAALARPLAEVPDAPERALAQADRAIAETLEHHAHVRLGRVAA